jgi:DNA-binding CsgD family transcriptional regulator
MSEANGKPPDELAPRRRRRRRKPTPRRPDNAVDRKHAVQIAALVVSAEARLEREATELRLQGLTFREIADRMGVSYESARAAFMRVMRKEAEVDQSTDPDALEAVRQLELGRLDRLWATWFPRATDEENPSMAAANYCLKVMKRRAEYLGLDREEKAPSISLHLDAEALARAAAAAGDATTLEAIERVASLYAHGEIVDAEFSEQDDHQEGDDQDEKEQWVQADPEGDGDRRDEDGQQDLDAD